MIVKTILLAVLAVVALASALAGVVFWPSGLKCDDESALATVKSLASNKLDEYSTRRVLLRNGSGSVADRIELDRRFLKGSPPLEFSLESFRERGGVGKGLRCAAMIYLLVESRKVFEFSTEYSIEPTTDGKTMISARFLPN